jgi:steroid 5-alpha reductase family enzyme
VGPIRYIFPAFVLAMWLAIGFGVRAGTWTGTNWLLLAVCFAACTIVFRNFVQVFSYGYGASLAVASLCVLALRPSVAAGLICGLGLAYGVRLCYFVYCRDRGRSYPARRRPAGTATARVPLGVRLGVWVPVSTLMAFEAMPGYFVARDGAVNAAVVGGAIVMTAGLLLESIADQQKQRAKDRDPDGFVAEGLYRYARHPNYLGEMIFQAGLLIAPLGTTLAGHERLTAMLAPAYILALMYYAGRGGDQRQAERLAASAEYAAYRARTGCFAPFF